MPRFYCVHLPPEAGKAGAALSAILDPDEAHHARRVLRMNPGDEVELFDGRGGVARGVIESWADGAVVRLTELKRVEPIRPALDVAVAIPKGPRADTMVEQLSQLGVDTLIPLLAERSVVDPRGHKLEKFARSALESAKQCGRAWLMKIDRPAALGELVNRDHDLKLIAMPGAKIGDMTGRLRGASRVLVLIGPEGGWTAQEIAASRAAGCEPWTLAPNVLRIETAAVAAAAILRSM